VEAAAASHQEATEHRLVVNVQTVNSDLDHQTSSAVRMPRHVVVVILDSLKRDALSAYHYEGPWSIDTPNLDRLAKNSMIFDRHHTGSLPCMPARHDLLVGSWDFLWRPWGSIEVWEDAITFDLRSAGVTTMLISDHPHLFEVGGENYHVDFSAWEYLRGHESDPWRTRPDPSWVGSPALPVEPHPRGHFAYEDSRTWFRSEEDFPGVKTMRAAADWFSLHAPAHERTLLVVDEFDPHEPFDTPEPWASRYRSHPEDPWMIWPPYAVDARARGLIDESQERSLRAAYAAKLSMIDHWFGELLDAVDNSPIASDTVVIVCTDHGLYLGERDVWGKPGYPIHDPLGHIPLMIRWPGVDPRRIDALTTTVDIHATLCDIFGISVSHRVHGHSLVPVVTGGANAVRDWALTGYWGREVQLITQHHTYTRGSVGGGFPLSMWSNRWSTMPVNGRSDLRLPRPDHRAKLEFMPGSSVPVIRQPFVEGDLLPFWAYGGLIDRHLLYDRQQDPGQIRNLAAESGERVSDLESHMIDTLRSALMSIDAPDDLFDRLSVAQKQMS
jgi:arylsulfatase A-like enzyme